METVDTKDLKRKMISRLAGLPPFLLLVTFLPAGTFDYWQAYIYCGILTFPMLYVLFYFLKRDQMFLVRRMRSREKEKQQVVLQIAFGLIFLGGFVISGLDRRFGWSDISVWLVLTIDVIMLIGYWIIFNVFKENSYASRVVEVEEDQEVISTGPYSIVRHPMYVGVLMMYIPTPIALGSWWGMIPMATIPIALVFRILNEEKVLREGLPGYKEYCEKVRYRLIPFLW